MADEADNADKQQQDFVEAGILRARRAVAQQQGQQRRLLPCGRCYYCGSDVAPGHLFCDAECSRDHENEEAARVRAHGIR